MIETWKDFLKELGTNDFVSEKIGVSKGLISHWKNGRKGRKAPPDVSRNYWNDLIKLAKEKDLNVDRSFLDNLKHDFQS